MDLASPMDLSLIMALLPVGIAFASCSGLLIVLLTAIGIATAFFGLILVYPLIGLASWRAYRELVPGSP